TFLGIPATAKSTTTICPRLTIAIVLVHRGIVPAFILQCSSQGGIEVAGVEIVPDRLDLIVDISPHQDVFLIGIRIDQPHGFSAALVDQVLLFGGEYRHV